MENGLSVQIENIIKNIVALWQKKSAAHCQITYIQIETRKYHFSIIVKFSCGPRKHTHTGTKPRLFVFCCVFLSLKVVSAMLKRKKLTVSFSMLFIFQSQRVSASGFHSLGVDVFFFQHENVQAIHKNIRSSICDILFDSIHFLRGL